MLGKTMRLEFGPFDMRFIIVSGGYFYYWGLNYVS